MNRFLFFLAISLFSGIFFACSPSVRMHVVQLNDVYEITPVQGGKYGGLARVATLIQEIEQKNPKDSVWVILAGDFLSPSLFGSVEFEGRKIRGLQMIETLNAMGLDAVTFGNHEFDIPESDLLERINASQFDWIASNTFHRMPDSSVQPFEQNGKALPPYVILNIPSIKGKDTLRLGVLGLTLPYNQQKHVFYADVNRTADSLIGVLQPQCDALIALTHLNISEDLELAHKSPQLRLLMGGHEHEHTYHKVGDTRVAKADANARSAYVHQLKWKARNNKLAVKSKLVEVTDRFVPDSLTETVANRWTDRIYTAFKQQGFNPTARLRTVPEPLDGLESHVRNKATNLGRLLGEAMCSVGDAPVAAVFNAGSIRVDDLLAGTLTEVDVLRTLPFGGKVAQVDLTGATLRRVLQAGEKNKGSGGYLQFWGIEKDESGEYLMHGLPIEDMITYRIMTTEYMIAGKEKNLDFLKEGAPGVIKVEAPEKWGAHTNDMRRVVINFLYQPTP